MHEVYILAGARTAIGAFQGVFRDQAAPKLGARALAGAIERAGVAPADLQQVYMGCALAAIAEIARREGIAWIVVGEPLRSDGSAGPPAVRARRFAARLSSLSGLPVETIDETLTSREADHRLREAGVPPARRQERRDALAAQLLLQEALDRRRARPA